MSAFPWQARVAASIVKKRLGDKRPAVAHVPLAFEGEALRYSIVGDAIEVELFREPCNEIGTTMLSELEIVARLLQEDRHEARALIFYSSVKRGFCAGADLRELYEGLIQKHETKVAGQLGAIKEKLEIASEVRTFIDRIHAVMDAIDTAPITIIGAIHGFCFGGGFELALTCDVLVADKSARFAFPELRLGLVPGFGGIPRLRRDLGNAVVRDLLLTGRSVNAKRANQLGLVSQVVARGEALKVARMVAQQAARFDPATTRAAKAFCKPFPREELEREKDLFIELLGSPVVEAALKKFVESDSVRPYLP